MVLKIPSAYTLVFILIIIFSILTWVLPAGKYDRVYNSKLNKEVVVANTYHHVESVHQGVESIATSFFKGIVSAIEIIAYLLIVGGSYGVILKTKAIHTALSILIKKLKNRAIILIPFLMLLFSALGSIIGFFEEGLAFYGIIIPFVLAMGFDALVALSIIFLGAATGSLASVLNPFSIGIGATLTNISINDGMIYRLVGWIICTFISIVYVFYYAKKIKKDPTKSYLYKIHNSSTFTSLLKDNKDTLSLLKFTLDKKIIVFLFLAMIITLTYGIIALHWDFAQMSMLFFLLAIISALITKEKEQNFWKSFLKGAEELLEAAILIALVRGIIIIANDGNIIDTILYYANSFFDGSSKISFVIINQIIQTLIGTLITSNSGQTVLAVPISASLAEMLHVPLSTIITSIQYGNGLANIFSPASAALLASLAITKVPYMKWIRFVLPVLIIQIFVILLINILTVI